LTWNIARRSEPWRELADSDADVALLQEAAAPPRDVEHRLEPNPEPWRTAGPGRPRGWRTAVVKLRDTVSARWIESVALAEARLGELGVSRPGTLAAAEVTCERLGETFTIVSMYGLWERPHTSTRSSWIYADASVHRLISDLSGFIGHRSNHKIIAAGDLNILHGYGEHGDSYWASRYATVFERFAAIGLVFVGPQAPLGRQAHPWPAELPADSLNVPTFFTNRQCPGTATRQLDFVFASRSLAHRLTVTAQNDAERWGPSDHCRVEIEVSRCHPDRSQT
jgi:hypothetical protein